MIITPLFRSRDITSSFGRQLGWRGIGMSGFAAVGDDDMSGYTLWSTTLGRVPTASDIQAIGDSGDFSSLRIFDDAGDTTSIPVTASVFRKLTGYTGKKKIPWAIIAGVAFAAWFFLLRKKR